MKGSSPIPEILAPEGFSKVLTRGSEGTLLVRLPVSAILSFQQCSSPLLSSVMSLVDSRLKSILKPVYSRSRLEISEACMLHILTLSRASSEFLKYLQAFGLKSYAQDEGFSGCDTTVTRDAAGAPASIGRLLEFKFNIIA